MWAKSLLCSLFATATLLAAVTGCAVFNDHESSLIQISSSRNPVKARRLTLAGVSALENGKRDYAREKLQAAIEADPDYGPAHNNLGLLQLEEGRLYQSVLSFERAMELLPTDPTVYYNLGLALEKADREHQALELYWQAVEIDPTEPHFLGNLVRLRRRLGENGPDVITQLRNLILIETRPTWRDWALNQLEVTLNPKLDRGPETPEFGGNDESTRERKPDDSTGGDEFQSNVIDLGNNQPPSQTTDHESERTPELLPPTGSDSKQPKLPNPDDQGATQTSMDSTVKVTSKPLPIRSEGAFRTLPESISEATDLNLEE